VRLEDDARPVARHGVANVEALDPERMQVLDARSSASTRARVRACQALLGEQLGRRSSAPLMHVEPGAARLARLVLDRRANPAARRQGLDQRRRRHG
jgi:hypothetical protein